MALAKKICAWGAMETSKRVESWSGRGVGTTGKAVSSHNYRQHTKRTTSSDAGVWACNCGSSHVSNAWRLRGRCTWVERLQPPEELGPYGTVVSSQ
jgi:hypothetical protein